MRAHIFAYFHAKQAAFEVKAEGARPEAAFCHELQRKPGKDIGGIQAASASLFKKVHAQELRPESDYARCGGVGPVMRSPDGLALWRA